MVDTEEHWTGKSALLLESNKSAEWGLRIRVSGRTLHCVFEEICLMPEFQRHIKQQALKGIKRSRDVRHKDQLLVQKHNTERRSNRANELIAAQKEILRK
jgi:hypothetical protein